MNVYNENENMIVLYLNLILSLTHFYVDKAPFKIKRLRSKNKKSCALLYSFHQQNIYFVWKKSQQCVLVSLFLRKVHSRKKIIINFVCVFLTWALPLKLIDFSTEMRSEFLEFSGDSLSTSGWIKHDDNPSLFYYALILMLLNKFLWNVSNIYCLTKL